MTMSKSEWKKLVRCWQSTTVDGLRPFVSDFERALMKRRGLTLEEVWDGMIHGTFTSKELRRASIACIAEGKCYNVRDHEIKELKDKVKRLDREIHHAEDLKKLLDEFKREGKKLTDAVSYVKDIPCGIIFGGPGTIQALARTVEEELARNVDRKKKLREVEQKLTDLGIVVERFGRCGYRFRDATIQS